MKIGLIGYGYWGPNLLRNLSEIDGLEVKWCADRRPDRLAFARRRHSSIQTTECADRIFDDSEVAAVVIATPVSTHYELAKAALESGKHVFIEKPMTRTVTESEELVAIAARLGLVLMVDHTFIYTGAVRKIKQIIESGDLGDLYYYDSVRVNLGLFQHDIDVLWDLATHDIAILNFLVPQLPKFVSATGADHTGRGIVDVAYMTLQFENNFIAHFHVNWLSPVKLRQSLIGGSRRMLVYDDMQPSEKLRIYDRGIEVTSQEGIYKALVDYRMGDMWAPKLELREALSVECEHFIDCVRKEKTPRSSGTNGLAVVKILDAAAKSLQQNGQPVALSGFPSTCETIRRGTAPLFPGIAVTK
jgi:predicted dehydrogenase